MKRFYFFLILFFFISSRTFSQDQIEEKIVGEGLKYTSIYRPSGPFNIKILEIDLSKPNVKIETVLAADELGKGYEKTSIMAQRKSRNKHLVVGAINADFFGNNQPTNSMIINKQYAKGVWSNRSLFGINSNNKPLIDVLSFSGSVFLKNDTLMINGCNSTRLENYLVLYTAYNGSNTKTNQWGTEIKITPIETFNINRPIKYKVIQKESWKGAMSLSFDSYVLSGHGKNQKLLDSLVNIGDTIQVVIGTNPNIGEIVNMLGGGPRLLYNGVKPTNFIGLEGFDESFVTTRHPRTAVGFSKDSTKVFFVTVDGRQTGFSVGMSLNELADLMLSLGAFNAVNLDGGGSTTMVIRDQIVNRPSDAAGERAVANSLIAVYEVETDKITKSISILPKTIVIDSGQIKLLEVKGKDIWDYDVPIDIKLIEWTFEGIKGIIDSNGFFIPQSIGSGKIIGKLNQFSDTILVTINPMINKMPTWQLSSAKNNLPNWFSNDGNTERGIAILNKEQDAHIYAVSRKYGSDIIILNAQNGDYLGKLKTEGISGGTYLLNDVEVTDDGKILVCNLTTNSSTSAFKIYLWNNETENPKSIIEFSSDSYRLGDKFTVVGSFNDNSAKIYAAAANSNKVLKWEMKDGAFVQQPKVITLNDISNVGINPSIAPEGINENKFIINANSITPREYDENGNVLGVIDPSIVPLNSNAIRFFKFNNKKYILTFVSGSGNEFGKIVDVTSGLNNAKAILSTETLGNNLNANFAGDVAFRTLNNSIIFYVLGTNNGLGAYEFSSSVTNIFTKENPLKPDNYLLYQNYPNPFNPSTNISFYLDSKQHVTLKIFDVLGRVVDILVNDYKDKGFYNVEWNAKGFSSGVYYYQLTINSVGKSLTRKMVIMK